MELHKWKRTKPISVLRLSVLPKVQTYIQNGEHRLVNSKNKTTCLLGALILKCGSKNV